MAEHNETGKTGEDLAAAWLISKGFTILHRNWRQTYHEIDIIATKDKYLHFIEVKTRRSSRYGNPEDSVSKRKFGYLKQAAGSYLRKHPGHIWIRYDILAITLRQNQEPEYFLLEDVYL